MAIVFADRVKVRSQSTGTGTFALESVVTGFQSFEAIGDGNECYYGIEDAQGNWEVGRGTYTSAGALLSRDTVIDSSNGGSLVDFPDGGKNAFVTLPSTVAGGIVASSASDSFSTIAVAGQSDVVADGSTDTLTLVAGSNVTLTTDAVTDTITIDSVSSSLENSGYTVSLETTGSILTPGDVTQGHQDNTVCTTGVDTVVYTSTGQFQHAIKLFVMVEGQTDAGGAFWDTQACDIIAVRGYNDDIVHVTAYGVTFSGAAAIATFDGQWNATAGRIEITCRPVSVVNQVVASVHAIEMSSND